MGEASRHPVLEVRDLNKSYLTKQGDRIQAVSGVSLALEDAEFVSVVGPSGCGKSTLMKMLAGVIDPTSGDIVFRGAVVHGAQDAMGVVFQSPVLLPWLTVFENVLLPIKILKADRGAAERRAHELLELVGLAEFERKYPPELSGGMQQRVSIVRGLIHNPRVLLMDEPFGALDALTREKMSLELQHIWLTHRKTVFFITHSIPEAVLLSDRVLVMSARPGRIVREFAVPFARPRDFDLTSSPEFGHIASEIRHLLGVTADV
jgi:NitT/TauT family transport system ATP-binding protein